MAVSMLESSGGVGWIVVVGIVDFGVGLCCMVRWVDGGGGVGWVLSIVVE